MSFSKVFLSLVLLNVFGLITAATVTVRMIQPRGTSNCEDRMTPGPICESCELLATCVQHSHGWVNIPVESCDMANGYYCNALLGTCSNATGPCHPFGIETNFQCTSQGVFPDPYDCQKYHMCYFVGTAPALVAAAVDCGNDKAFDASTGQCSLNLQSNVCTQPQYQCPRVGYVAAWPNNPNIFYVCKSTVNQNLNDSIVIYPSLHRCNDGEVFEDFVCRPGNYIPGQPIPQFPDNPNNNGSTGSPTRCGYSGLIADMDDCNKYYYCSSASSEMQHLQCPQGTHYRPEQSSCVLGSC